LLLDLRQALALANKAGKVVTGFGKVEAALAGERSQALRKRFGEAISGIPVIEELPGAELDLALGRPHVIHAALVAGAGSDGFVARWHRLRRYRGQAADEVGFQGEPGQNDPMEPAGLERD
jgi:hypothetical protein